MKTIVRRNEGTPQQTRGYEPTRRWRDIWDPFAEMMPALFQDERGLGFSPDFEVKETKDAYVFKADLPGVREPDLDISLTGNRLVVSGKREAEERKEEENYFMFERSYGTFTRAFTLPEGIDPEQVQADLKDGVLTIAIPKRPEAQPKKISLKGMVEKVKEKVRA